MMFRYLGIVITAFVTCCHVTLVMCDFPCMCTYAMETEVHAAKDAASKILGYLYEFDCKELYAVAANDSTWTAVAFKHQVGYIQKTKDHEIQQCPGSPDATDTVPTSGNPITLALTTAPPSTQFPTTVKISTAAPTTASPSTAPHLSMHSTPAPEETTELQEYKCPFGVVEYALLHGGHVTVQNDSCFEIVSQPMTWNDSEHHCNANGGHLAYITSQSEENSIMTFLYKEGFKQSVWIGLTDQGKEENWFWSSGYPYAWANWFPFRYNSDTHNSEDCVALVPDMHVIFGIHTYGQWNDLQCAVLNPSLCRYDAHPIQQGTTTPHGLLGFLSNLAHSIALG
ncbi:collectin-12-like isoform X1 [Dreissena polymorpha]|uniref:collectin-12-like isoform X1 n=2 Tax=Dreissena polymorpha TaxID=45954 RepID=UPI0022650C3F|nr:collectin-12-like isoform X1 [Dreissena polymorpha]